MTGGDDQKAGDQRHVQEPADGAEDTVVLSLSQQTPTDVGRRRQPTLRHTARLSQQMAPLHQVVIIYRFYYIISAGFEIYSSSVLLVPRISRKTFHLSVQQLICPTVTFQKPTYL